MLADHTIAPIDAQADAAGIDAARRASAFNLFRRRESPDLFCAVPEDRVVPPFIEGESWEFGGRIAADSVEQPGFDGGVASRASRFNGFYLFQSWNHCK
jgi:hypothetical protein